jgi:hypothetical protein
LKSLLHMDSRLWCFLHSYLLARLLPETFFLRTATYQHHMIILYSQHTKKK